MRETATASAPGSVGNVGPGLDILGLAVTGGSDTVELRARDGSGIVVVDPGHPALPTDPARHAAAIAVRAVFDRCGHSGGVNLRLTKRLPLSGGQGGSAASAIAGAVAADHLCEAGLDHRTLLACALIAEEQVAGRHADNLAPALLGGLVLIRSLDPIDFVALPVPALLKVVMVHPDQALQTRAARALLPATVTRGEAMHQAACVAAMVAAAYRNDVEAFGRGIDDRIAEPARAPLLPGFVAAKRAALAAGAWGCSISGAGPTAFAIVSDDITGRLVADAMVAAYGGEGIVATARIADADRRGAIVA